MAQGRILGSVSADGKLYELKQGDRVLQTFEMDAARDDKKLAAAVRRNGWEALP